MEGAVVRAECSWTLSSVLEAGGRYRWRVRARQGSQVADWSGWAVFRVQTAPRVFELLGNRPNPFNPRTQIFFRVARSTRVEIVITDARGREVRRIDLGTLAAGLQSVLWNGDDARGDPASSGVYFYLVRAGSESLAGKMVLVR